MRYGKYVFSCKFNDNAVLPEYKGSSFRGVFGYALKKVVCALKREDCAGCLLRSRCIYAFVFETRSHIAAQTAPAILSPDNGRSRKPRIVAPPHPYVIEPADDNRTRYNPGDTFDFSLLLFGPANDYLPYFIYAFDQIGQLGIGKRIDGKRATFALMHVISGENIVYSSGNGRIIEGDFTEILPTDGPRDSGAESAAGLEIRLVTPLRVKFENHLEASLPFHILIRAALRRISSLSAAYGGGEPAFDYPGLVARARNVETAPSSLHWFDWKRYSNRQDQAMLMGGMIGKVRYEGQFAEFIPLLEFCEKAHLGKQTAFGLGKISLNLRFS